MYVFAFLTAAGIHLHRMWKISDASTKVQRKNARMWFKEKCVCIVQTSLYSSKIGKPQISTQIINNV